MLTHRLQAVLRKMNDGRTSEKTAVPNPLRSKHVASENSLFPKLSEETVHFASHGTHGIVDLGASMSVIGEQQFLDLCRELHKYVKKSMQEASCSVSFRFGNDSTVVGRRSVFFPVGSKWIKVVIVPTNTPFLIANSVFRSLGAVIDVANQNIRFKELGKTVPIRLTDRKLFRLDLLDLLQNHGEGGSEEVMFSSCHNLEGHQVGGHTAVVKPRVPTDSHEHASTQAESKLS